MTLSSAYEATANELRDRILALIPTQPLILEMVDVWDLFRVEGFKCDDLQPSLAQAQAALRSAQETYKTKGNE